MKGWVGVRLDLASTDWGELAILLEEGWLSIAPPSIVRGGAPAAQAPRPPPPVRATTDPEVARAALERLSKICLALPGASRERESRHASFLVGKKTFAYFLDNHHGDGIVSACFRGERRRNAALAQDEPKRFYLPAYIGPRGWLGVRLDRGRVDWKDVEARAGASWRAVAPKRLSGGGSKGGR